MEANLSQPSFEKFINTINKQEARDLVRSINVFMRDLRAKPPDPDSDSRAVQDFMVTMESAFANHPLWVGCTQADLDAAVEGLEKYLMTKLFDRTWGVDELDRERDAAITARLRALQFVRPEHLEIGSHLAADTSLLMAQKELAKINAFKSPREKLVCVLSCCKVINNLLASKKYGAGADDFTPVLIYVTIRAAPDTLASNLSFIERYRTASRLVSEAQYFFVQMQSAVAFIETLDVHGSLKVDPDELIAHMLAAGALTDADLAMMTASRSSSYSKPPPNADHSNPTSHPPPPPPPADPARPPAAPAPIDLLDFGPSEPSMPSSIGNMVEVVDNFTPYANPLWQASGGPGGLVQGSQQQQRLIGQGVPPPPPPPPGSAGHTRTPSFDPFQQMHAPPPPPPPPMTDVVVTAAAASAPPPPPPHNAVAFNQPGHPGWVSGGMAGGSGGGGGALPPPPPPLQSPLPPGAPGLQPGRVQGSGYGVPPPLPPPPPRAPPPPRPPQSVADLEAEGTRILLKSHQAGKLQARYPLLYAHPDQLSLGQVRQLLSSYKEVVLKYEALVQGVERAQQQYKDEQQAHLALMNELAQQAAYQAPPPPPPPPPIITTHPVESIPPPAPPALLPAAQPPSSPHTSTAQATSSTPQSPLSCTAPGTSTVGADVAAPPLPSPPSAPASDALFRQAPVEVQQEAGAGVTAGVTSEAGVTREMSLSGLVSGSTEHGLQQHSTHAATPPPPPAQPQVPDTATEAEPEPVTADVTDAVGEADAGGAPPAPDAATTTTASVDAALQDGKPEDSTADVELVGQEDHVPAVSPVVSEVLDQHVDGQAEEATLAAVDLNEPPATDAAGEVAEAAGGEAAASGDVEVGVTEETTAEPASTEPAEAHPPETSALVIEPTELTAQPLVVAGGDAAGLSAQDADLNTQQAVDMPATDTGPAEGTPAAAAAVHPHAEALLTDVDHGASSQVAAGQKEAVAGNGHVTGAGGAGAGGSAVDDLLAELLGDEEEAVVAAPAPPGDAEAAGDTAGGDDDMFSGLTTQ